MPDKKPSQKVPDHVIESLARSILPAIRHYFESKEGQREFEEWKTNKEKGDIKESDSR